MHVCVIDGNSVCVFVHMYGVQLIQDYWPSQY